MATRWSHHPGKRHNTADAYLYSPAFAQLIWPLAQLAWPAFAAVYSALLLVVLVWLIKPLPLRLAIPLNLAGLNEVMTGNVFLIFAVVAVLGFRHPSSWAFVALTKVTPFLGPMWFLVRREWRRLAVSMTATVLMATASAVMAPQLWMDWLSYLTAHHGEAGGSVGSALAPPLAIRLPMALVFVAWGAFKNKRWTLPTAMLLATPVFGWGAFAILLALPRVNKDASDDHLSGSANVWPARLTIGTASPP